jgi:glycosyltransferase involved in cell wall biosynthesis
VIKHIINVAELANKEWDFIERYYPSSTPPLQTTPEESTTTAVNINWTYFSGSAINFFERLVSKPKISRYRACLQATLAIKTPNDIVISHLPRTSHWQSVAMNLFKRKNKHLAFSFNFTDLPTGNMHRAMQKSFQRIDDFVVYSQFEKKRYSDYFNIPTEKIHHIHWAMDTPKTDKNFTPIKKPYYYAVGGEGRDYATLIEAFKYMPEKDLVIVTRPNTLKDINIPNNIHIFYNLPSKQFWRIVEKSISVIVSLVDEQTACGHITLVGAMQLEKALITTFSHGTTDYIRADENAIVIPPKNVEALKKAITVMDENNNLRQKIEINNLAFTKKYCQPDKWAAFIHAYANKI